MKTSRYECYSYHLMKFLLDNGTVPTTVTKHNRTNKTMWIYERDEKLSDLLGEWSKRKTAISSDL